MEKKVTLPPLPDKEPTGSMLAYLDKVRQKQNDIPLKNESSDTDREPPNFSENSHSATEFTDLQPTDHHNENSKPTGEKMEVTHIEVPIEHFPSLGSLPGEMSKILDKPEYLAEVDSKEEKTSSVPNDLLTVSLIETGSNLKRKVKGVKTSNESLLIDFLNKLPLEFTNYSFAKGEMKIRVSENMAYFLKLMSDSCPEAKAIRYLSENLVNRLLWQFFQTYGAEIETLHREMERQRMMNHTRRMGTLKNN